MAKEKKETKPDINAIIEHMTRPWEPKEVMFLPKVNVPGGSMVFPYATEGPMSERLNEAFGGRLGWKLVIEEYGQADKYFWCKGHIMFDHRPGSRDFVVMDSDFGEGGSHKSARTDLLKRCFSKFYGRCYHQLHEKRNIWAWANGKECSDPWFEFFGKPVNEIFEHVPQLCIGKEKNFCTPNHNIQGRQAPPSQQQGRPQQGQRQNNAPRQDYGSQDINRFANAKVAKKQWNQEGNGTIGAAYKAYGREELESFAGWILSLDDPRPHLIECQQNIEAFLALVDRPGNAPVQNHQRQAHVFEHCGFCHMQCINRGGALFDDRNGKLTEHTCPDDSPPF